MEKSSGCPEWVENVADLETWLSGYEAGKFDPSNAIINLLFPKNMLNSQGEERYISRVSATIKPKPGSTPRVSLTFRVISNPPEEIERRLKYRNNEPNKWNGIDTEEQSIGPLPYDRFPEKIVSANKRVMLAFSHAIREGKLVIALANSSKGNNFAGESTEDEEENQLLEKSFQGDIGDWIKTAFCLRLVIHDDAGFDIIEDRALKLSYLAQSGTFCKATNTSFRVEKDETEIVITSLPVYKEKRFEPWEGSGSCLRFVNLSLSNEPEKVLANLGKAADEIEARAKKSREHHIRLASGRSDFSEELAINLEAIEKELANIRNGIKILQSDKAALWAFRFLNSAMEKKGGGFNTWRPFQAALLLTCISKYRSERGNQPIALNFPTGMGKTEAFLGYALWIAAYQRKTGINFGTSAIIKYPRVMLSKQQANRALGLISAANSCMLESKEINAIPFSLGMLFSKDDTPNRMISIVDNKPELSPQFQKLIDTKGKSSGFDIRFCNCPNCKGKEKVELQPDPTRGRIFFISKSKNCIYHRKEFTDGQIFERVPGEIPIYIADEEVFRYLPTIIITTVYKFATFCTSARWKTLLGNSQGKASSALPIRVDNRYGHWYYTKDKEDVLALCSQKGYKWISGINVKECPFRPAALIIIDEVHLLRGSQASLLGPIETAFLEIFKDQSGRLPQVISSSATISRARIGSGMEFQEHLAQLFGCAPIDAILLPASLEMYDSKKDEIQRIIVAVCPAARAKVFAGEKLTTFLVNRMRDAKREYQVPLYYFISKSDMGLFKNNLESRISDQAGVKEGLSSYIVEFSADVSNTGSLDPEMMEDIANKLEELDKGTGFKLALATNLIANGIDSDRFNCMLFWGLPGSISEYVQARSRIARRPGKKGLTILSLTRFNPREKAFFENFYSWHYNQEYLFEATPVNKYSEGVVDKTIQRLLHLYAFWIWDTYDRKVYVTKNMLQFLVSTTQSGGVPFISNWLSVPIDNTSLSWNVNTKIRNEINGYHDFLHDVWKEREIYGMRKGAPKNPHLPKPSTLQVSEEIPIRLSDSAIQKLKKIFNTG